MSQTFTLAKPNRTVHVGIILAHGLTELQDVAPIDLLSNLSKSFQEEFAYDILPETFTKQAMDMEFHWVTEEGETARLSGGLTVQATDSFANCPPLDIVLMGASQANYKATPAELEFVRKSYDDCSAFLCICGGSQIPVEAGVLRGKTATAPRPLLDDLRKSVTDTQWVDKRWYRDGKLWTSGTLLNGLDLMRAFGEATYGREGSLVQMCLDMGAWPKRDVDYADDN